MSVVEKDKKPRMGVLIRMDKTDNSIGHATTWLRCFPVIIKQPQGYATDFTYCSSYSDACEYTHIQLKAMLADDVQKPHATCGGGSLSAEDIYSAHCHELERTVKAMKAIEKKFEKIRAEYGTELSFGQLVGRFARAIGADLIISERDPQSRERTGEKWRFETVEFGVSTVDHMIYKWNVEHNASYKEEVTL